MKYLITIILSILALTANAQHHRPYPHHGHGGARGWGWVAPALIGGAIVYSATRPATPPPPVVYQTQPLPPPPYGYHYEQILDANCNCYRWVLIQG